jgi:hypothetical protein
MDIDIESTRCIPRETVSTIHDVHTSNPINISEECNNIHEIENKIQNQSLMQPTKSQIFFLNRGFLFKSKPALMTKKQQQRRNSHAAEEQVKSPNQSGFRSIACTKCLIPPHCQHHFGLYNPRQKRIP